MRPSRRARPATWRVLAASLPAIATISKPGCRRNAGDRTARPKPVPRIATRDAAWTSGQKWSGSIGVKPSPVKPRGRMCPASLPFSFHHSVSFTGERRHAVRSAHAELAHLIVHQLPTKLQAGEAILIEAFDLRARSRARSSSEEVQKVGGVPIVALRDKRGPCAPSSRTPPRSSSNWGAIELHQMKQVQAYVGIRASDNVSELADVPSDKMALYRSSSRSRCTLNHRVNNTRWVVLRHPNAGMAQLANTSTEKFGTSLRRIGNVDYKLMQKAIVPLRERMLPPTACTSSRRARTCASASGRRRRFVPRRAQHSRRRVLHGAGARLGRGHDPLQHAVGLPRHDVCDQLEFTFEKGRIVKATGNLGQARPAARHRRGRALHRRVLARLQPEHPEADEGHAVRRRRSRARCTSRPASATRRPRTATASKVHWDPCSSSAPITVAARSGSTTS